MIAGEVCAQTCSAHQLSAHGSELNAGIKIPAFACLILKVIAEHLFREGRFDVGEIFAREAGLEGVEKLRQPYVAMHTILQQVFTRISTEQQSCTMTS